MSGDRKEYRGANLVRVNVPLAPGRPAPDPGAPLVTIDGIEVQGVRRLVVSAGVGELTTVSIVFLAQVVGQVEAALNLEEHHELSDDDGRRPGDDEAPGAGRETQGGET